MSYRFSCLPLFCKRTTSQFSRVSTMRYMNSFISLVSRIKTPPGMVTLAPKFPNIVILRRIPQWHLRLFITTAWQEWFSEVFLSFFYPVLSPHFYWIRVCFTLKYSVVFTSKVTILFSRLFLQATRKHLLALTRSDIELHWKRNTEKTYLSTTVNDERCVMSHQWAIFI